LKPPLLLAGDLNQEPKGEYFDDSIHKLIPSFVDLKRFSWNFQFTIFPNYFTDWFSTPGSNFSYLFYLIFILQFFFPRGVFFWEFHLFTINFQHPTIGGVIFFNTCFFLFQRSILNFECFFHCKVWIKSPSISLMKKLVFKFVFLRVFCS
jgi:hypothetical protein